MSVETPHIAQAGCRRGRSACTAHSLMRLLALYLAIILAWQMVAAAHIQGAGVLHGHGPAGPVARPAQRSAASPPHVHDAGVRHWHAGDATVRLQDDPAALAAAAQALLAAMAALMVAATGLLATAPGDAVRPVCSRWPALTGSPRPPWRPPWAGSTR